MNRHTLNTLAAVFGWSFLFCVALQLFALVMITSLHDVAYDMHSRLFSISVEAFDIAVYSTIGAMKTLGMTLFLCPWAALRLVASRLPE